MSPGSKVREKIERLIERLVEQKVVPFLGAGISKGAIHEEGINKLADTGNMIKNTAINIYRLQRNGNDNQKKWCRWCCESANHGLINTSLDRLCEMYLWLSNEDVENLVKNILLVDEFVNLKPTPAHRYIAFLAREELIDEVITTNYDTCLEKSYIDTFSDLKNDIDEKNIPARVVTKLEEYRENAGKVYVENDGQRLRCLKVYKINGCAKKFKNDNTLKDSILLTEYQLQDWRQRHWARDLFRDRLRSRTLVFSGFGSDEPQVRHTALQVVEEFQNTNNSVKDWWTLPNAPFIATYENRISFNQLQILYAFTKAHGGSMTFDEVHRNAFTGIDAGFFGCTEQKLTADNFWKRVFQIAFWRLLKEYCTKNSRAFNYLSAIIPPTEALFQDMLDWIIPEDKPFGRFPNLLEVNNGNGYTLLSLWVWCIRYRKNMPQAGWYAPLKDRPVLIPLLFLILYLVFAGDDNEHSWEKLRTQISIENGFFRLKISNDQFNIFIAHQEKAFQDQEKVELPQDFKKTALVQIIISNSSMEMSQRKRIKIYNTKNIENNGTCEIRMVSVYQIPFRELFQNGYTLPRSAYMARAVFHESLSRTVLLVDRVRPRLRNRAKPI
ncbi:MAG: SIR2 family protein [Peptococcaceae bacterium]|nr:SIR2 family protein [Peptococcaceae bacterium]